MLRHHPPGRKNHEVKIRRPGNFRWRRQHRINRWVGMIEAHRVNAIEIRQVIFVGYIVPMPRYDIQWRVINRRRPDPPLKLRHELEVTFALLKRRHRGQKIARIRQSVRPDRTKIWQPEQGASLWRLRL